MIIFYVQRERRTTCYFTIPRKSTYIFFSFIHSFQMITMLKLGVANGFLGSKESSLILRLKREFFAPYIIFIALRLEIDSDLDSEFYSFVKWTRCVDLYLESYLHSDF